LKVSPLGDQFIAVDDLAGQQLVGSDDPPHLGLDCRKILFGEGPILRRKVVVEPVLGRRSESDLRRRKQVLHRLGQDVRKVMTDEIERFFLIARGDQRQAGVDFRRQRRLGQARPDRRSYVGRGRSGRHLAHGTVG
jgi:hypothetical protein